MMADGGVRDWGLGLFVALCLALTAAAPTPKSGPGSGPSVHEGVASCANSTCHGRQVASGLVVRQNELVTWQDPSGSAGAHARAFRALGQPRAQAIANRLGLGPAERASACLGCHTDPASGRGERFQIADGVGCEACHGGAGHAGSGGWLASHYALGATHAANVAAGMTALDNPRVRAGVCLDCHFGSARNQQFVSHELMSAGHPRLSFELDLFTELQRHHDVDADYPARGKTVAGGVKTWALGQTMALQRALALYADPQTGQAGAFPEFAFFDCHSCHRQISDEAATRPAFQPNAARPIPHGAPPFNDESMIVLTAAARVAAPALAERFESDAMAFHASLARDRPSAVRAAAQLARTTVALENTFQGHPFSRAETLAILDQVTGDALSGRYTDYTGGAQAVMAIDTLLTALMASGPSDAGAAAAAVRSEINRAYQAVRDPNGWRPAAFREALTRVAAAIRRLR